MTNNAQSMMDDFSAYTDLWGLLQPQPNTTSDNGLLFTGEKIALFSRRPEWVEPDFRDENAAAFHWAIQHCEMEPGLYRRSPNNFAGLEQWDDYYGLTTGAALIGNNLVAREVLDYGWKHWLSWNNVDGKWTRTSFLGRNWHFVAHLYLAAGLRPPLVFGLAWKLWMRYQHLISPTSQDDRIMIWLSCQVARLRGGSWADWAVWWERNMLPQSYKGGIHDLWQAYFEDKSMPLIKWSENLPT